MIHGFGFAAGKGSVPVDEERNFALGVGGFRYGDLFEPERLAALDAAFRAELNGLDAALAQRFESYRAGAPLSPPAESELLIAVARVLARFVARLFDIEQAHQALLDRATHEAVVFELKNFVKRRAISKYPERSLPPETGAALREQLVSLCATRFPELVVPGDEELTFAASLSALLAEETAAKSNVQAVSVPLAEALDLFERWAAVHRFVPAARTAVAGWVSFHFPHSVDYDHLVELRRPDPALPEITEGPSEHRRRRDGFALTDSRMSAREVSGEADYCVYCPEREKDSCSKGMRDKQHGFKKNPLNVELAGCPLDERIGEMHVLRKDGDSLAALAVIVIDNPMLPGTGHRICNDCMKSCIFQKQEPVNIPQAETGVLTDVLGLRFGFEIYGLFTRWNPLNRARPVALPYRGRNVLVVGLGPAGYTLAQHLLNDGFGVVGIEGLKVEPLAADLIGADAWPPRAVERWSDLAVPLEERRAAGFGGVAEYGITVRWDKNFLTAIHATLDVSRLRWRALWRHAGCRRRLRARLRSHRARRWRRQTDDHRRQKQPDPRGAQGLRLPDGPAALGRVQQAIARQLTGAPARARDRRRPDGDRHHHGGRGLLPGASRKVPTALGKPVGGRRGRKRIASRIRPRRARGAGGVPGARSGRAQGACTRPSSQ